MTEHEPQPTPDDDRIARTLLTQRPQPGAAFASDLREQLRALRWAPSRPAQLWLLVAAWVACGIVLLLLAALGAGGTGPFA
jgi:hypothetical protein